MKQNEPTKAARLSARLSAAVLTAIDTFHGNHFAEYFDLSERESTILQIRIEKAISETVNRWLEENGL